MSPAEEAIEGENHFARNFSFSRKGILFLESSLLEGVQKGGKLFFQGDSSFYSLPFLLSKGF